VAQNKMPHRRICNISVTSGLILKILEAWLKVQWIHCIPLDSEKCQDYAASRIFILSYFILSHPVRTILLLIAEVKRNAELDIYQLEWRALHGRGHYCSRAKPTTPLNIKLSVAHRSASADDVSQMSSLLAAVAATHAPRN